MDLDGDAKPNPALLSTEQSGMAPDGAAFDHYTGDEPGVDATGSDTKAPIKRRAPIACRRFV